MCGPSPPRRSAYDRRGFRHWQPIEHHLRSSRPLYAPRYPSSQRWKCWDRCWYPDCCYPADIRTAGWCSDRMDRRRIDSASDVSCPPETGPASGSSRGSSRSAGERTPASGRWICRRTCRSLSWILRETRSRPHLIADTNFSYAMRKFDLQSVIRTGTISETFNAKLVCNRQLCFQANVLSFVTNAGRSREIPKLRTKFRNFAFPLS